MGGIVEGLLQSVTLGAGQFCTNPGLVFGPGGELLERFVAHIAQQVVETPSFTMLHGGIQAGYQAGVQRWIETPGVRCVGAGGGNGESATPAQAAVYATDAATFAAQPHLHEEVFGPATLVVACDTAEELENVAQHLEGNLTATLHGTRADLIAHAGLVRILERKVGRLLFNGFPTGVEVGPSMHHGGPYPATTDVRSTSVGTAALLRFARPICYQSFPAEALPPELMDENPRGIWRLVDNRFSRDPV
jgi:NADP-dependent aldehyde dehydrogenase